MTSDSNLITLVVHTTKRAAELKKILSAHSISADLVPLSPDSVDVPGCMQVKIDPIALPVALKIIESGGPYSAVKVDMELSGSSGCVLIPVDFTERAYLACEVGLALAVRLGLHPVILHAYTSPLRPLESQFDGGDLAFLESEQSEVEAAEAYLETEHEQAKLLKNFASKIRGAQKDGSMPNVDFTLSLVPGVPEEAIAEYCRQTPPAVVVMATRGAHRKASELIGSVTAEVLDSSRIPVFALPEDYEFIGMKEIKNLLFFCDLDRQDLISIDSLMRMFDYPDVNITLVPVSERPASALVDKLSALCRYLAQAYPTATFNRIVFPKKTFREDLGSFISRQNIQLLIVPNKKSNIFRRLFRPGIAHRLLFEGDMPMLAIPV